MIGKPTKTHDHIEKEIGEELLVYNESGGSIHVLNETAAFIYNLCDGNNSLKDIIAKTGENFQDSYDVDDDVEGIVKDLYDLKLVKEE